MNRDDFKHSAILKGPVIYDNDAHYTTLQYYNTDPQS